MHDALTYYDLIGFVPGNPETATSLPDVPDLSRIALFLDFDGTLVEIAERPDAVQVPSRVQDLLTDLNRRTGGAVAIVSGRRMADLERFLPDFAGTLVGSHGGEWRDSGNRHVAEEAGSDTFAHLRDMLRAWVGAHDGVLLEEKPAALVLHYRRAPQHQVACGRIMAALADDTPAFTVRHAKMAVELMPERICKRGSVETLLQRWADRTPVAIGDDRPDEGMFGLVEERGGFAIRVGDEETRASYRVGCVADVHAMLACWLREPAGSPCRVG